MKLIATHDHHPLFTIDKIYNGSECKLYGEEKLQVQIADDRGMIVYLQYDDLWYFFHPYIEDERSCIGDKYDRIETQVH